MEVELARLLDSMTAMVWTALPNGNVKFINREWFEFLGQPPDEASRWDWRDWIHPGYLPAVVADWRSIVASGECGKIEARARQFDEECHLMVMRAGPIHDEQGRILRCVQ